MAATKLVKPAALGAHHTAGIYSDMTVDGPVIGTLIAMGFRYWAMNRFVFPAQQTQPAEPATLDA